MRPYFSIILDSFRAAFASRVLYALLAIIVLLLLALAPLHLREGLDWQLTINKHVTEVNGSQLGAYLVENKDSDSHPEVKQIWSRLDQEIRDRLNKNFEDKTESTTKKEKPEPTERRRSRPDNPFKYIRIVGSLNEIILGDSLYDEAIWKDRRVGEEATALIEDQDNLTSEQQRRLNRLLISDALPMIQPPDPSNNTVYYGWFELIALTTGREFFVLALTEWIALILDKFVMSLGLMVGVLVTANIIPETFDPGSLNLLLSKPISRAGLYITKFIGGCVLIAICSVLLFTGLWLWLGLAARLWEPALLWSIPIYILVFAMYFSVSAFIGLVFRSPIMAIVMTVVFWGVCWSLGFGYTFVNNAANNGRLYNVATNGTQVLAQNGSGQVVQWNEGEQKWDPVAEIASGNPEEAIGMSINYWLRPLKLAPYLVTPQFDGQGNGYAATRPFPEMSFSSRHAFFYTSEGSNDMTRIGSFPRDVMASFGTQDGLLVVDRQGNFMAIDAAQVEKEKGVAPPVVVVSEKAGPQPPTPQIVANPLEKKFRKVGPKNAVRVAETYAVAYNQSNQEVVIHEFKDGEHRLYVFTRNGDQYEQSRSVQFDLGSKQRIKCFVEYQGNTIVVVAGNGQVITFAGDTLQEKNGYRPETQFPIDALVASPDGRWFAMAYTNQKLWLLDTQNEGSMELASVTGQGAVSSVSFDSDNRLWVVDRQDRAIQYDAETMSPLKTCSAAGGVFEMLYRYCMRPLYTVFPKPSEFYKVVQYFSSTRDTESNKGVDLIGIIVPSDPLSPLYSGLGFMAFMLLISCTIFHFKDY